jgi:hypothetical protein
MSLLGIVKIARTSLVMVAFETPRARASRALAP